MLSTEPQVLADYADTGLIRYAYWPILDHGPTQKTYEAAECAGEQDPAMFWAIHDLFYQDQAQLWSADSQAYVDFAARAGVSDLDGFRQCLDEGRYAQKTLDLDRLRRSDGIRLRPTFSIDGQVIAGAQSYAQLAALLDGALGR